MLPTPGFIAPMTRLRRSTEAFGTLGRWRMRVLGRIDLTSGHIAEYHLDTPMSGPHGLVADRDGAIWFTANFFAGLYRQISTSPLAKSLEYKICRVRTRETHTRRRGPTLLDQDRGPS